MEGAKLNKIIAAVIVLVNSIIPFLQIIGALDLTTDGLAALYLVISNVGTVVGLLFAQSSATNT